MPVFSCIRSLYIDWHMVVVVGGREGELFGRGNVRVGICPKGEMSRGVSYTQCDRHSQNSACVQ